MKQVIESQAAPSELNRWRGAHAAIWLFNVTHKRLALRLSRPDEPEVLYLVAVGCEHICGSFSWDRADLNIEQKDDEARVVDGAAGFELACSSVTVVRGPATELDSSFEGFLGEPGK